MAKPEKASKPENSSSTSAPTDDGKMVLRIRTRSMKQSSSLAIESSPRRLSKKAKTKNKASTAKIDSKKPKKPPTAFFYFLEDFRKDFQEQNPDIKSMRDVGKACGEKWKTMTYEEKVQYYDIATEKRAAFDRAMTEYNKRMENKEEEEMSDEDSEFED